MGNRCFGGRAPPAPVVPPPPPGRPAPTPSQPAASGGKASAYIPNLEKLTSDIIRDKWSDLPRQQNPPCHIVAINCMTLHPTWVAHTGLLRQMREATKQMKGDKAMSQRMATSSHFEKVMLEVVKKGYSLQSDSEAKGQRDVIHNDKIIVKSCLDLWNSLDYRRKHLTYAMELLRDLEKPSGIVAKLTEICDRAHRCMSAKRQAFVLAVTYSYQLAGAFGDSQHEQAEMSMQISDVVVEDGRAGCLIDKCLKKHMEGKLGGKGEDEGSKDAFVCALARVYECVELFLDSHKEKAFLSAFIEPARCYFAAVGDTHQRDHVNIHGINWYLALLHGGLGVQLPLMSAYNDGDNIGVCDFWTGLTLEAWDVFSDERNFGKAFEGIKAMRTDHSLKRFLNTRVPANQLPVGHHSTKAKHLGNEVLNSGSGGQAAKLAVYLERYAHFFRRDFLTQRMFEGLNSESQPEYVGFRKACNLLYASYPLRQVEKETFVEFVYSDEYYTELDLQRVGEFFEWILVFAKTEKLRTPQVVRTPSEIAREEGGGKETCPICMEEKDDVELLDHWMPQGDVSEHKMCVACKAAWENHEMMECPFCRELLHADEMTTFIKNAVAAVSHQQKAMSPDEAAAIMEQWQMLEMMLQGQQSAIRRVAKLIVEHKDFESSITKGTKKQCAWLRDMAGIVFRLDAMYKDGDLKVSQQSGKMLADAVESFMTPLEGSTPQRMDPHFYGALYMQAVTPWLCAWRAQAKTKTLEEHVRRVGRIVQLGVTKNSVNRKAIKERLLEEYVQLAHEPVWGSQAEDILYQTVYK